MLRTLFCNANISSFTTVETSAANVSDHVAQLSQGGEVVIRLTDQQNVAEFSKQIYVGGGKTVLLDGIHTYGAFFRQYFVFTLLVNYACTR